MTTTETRLYTLDFKEARTYLWALAFVAGNVILPQLFHMIPDGGKMFLRSKCENVAFPAQVSVNPASDEDLEELKSLLGDYCEKFGLDLNEVLDAPFTVVSPDSGNPYRQMYVAN